MPKYSHWDVRFLELAAFISGWSKDPSTKVGAVFIGGDRQILATGFNGFPRGIADDERLHNREQKYPIICHGEENGILDAARRGVSLLGSTVYVTPWPSCLKCTRGLIQVGVKRVVFPDTPAPDRWKAELEGSKALYKEAMVQVDYIPMV